MIRMETRALRSRTVAWRESGPAWSRDVLVWLHAFPLTSEMWTAQMDVPGWRTIAPDLAGLGSTEDDERTPDIADFAKDTITLLDDIGVEQIVLGGLSMGGYAALALHRLAPHRLRGLILADTRSTADTPAGRVARETMLGIVESKGPVGVAAEMLPKLLGATTHRERPEVVSRVRALIEGNAATGIARAVRRIRDRPDLTPDPPSITVPTLVIVGEEDALTPVEDSRALAAGITDATLVVLPRAGHLSNLEAPDSFNGAFGPWLAGVASSI
jgi:pimeloyl-ACP methyl ester carboxylesterase